MKEEFSSGASWNSAAVYGLVMAVATIALDYLCGLTALAGGFAAVLLSTVAKIAKIVACLWLFRLLMLKFFSSFKTDYTHFYHFGMKVALFSSIIVAGFSLVQITVINPDEFNQLYRQALESNPMLDANSRAVAENMMSSLPAMMFFFNLVYCFLWGWTLSSVYAKAAFPPDEFGDRTGNGGDEGNGWNGDDRWNGGSGSYTDADDEESDNQ